ncbi:ATP-binding cassette domain-containing protein [Mycoplasma buteonis]|uniref:ATP-binding cassette domain-containing protein n=1 Tax=Mycoplasma buteonis TaxID=171280 RepID=UPI0005650C23|nr:ATP-binding cassette domain-containing protein [Mycoplasma buteonis]
MKNNQKEQPILELSGLKKYFVNGSRINKAVDNVSFEVKKGEIVGLIGESGSGKTTVGRSLLRLYDDFSGFVTLQDQIISGKRISRKRAKFMHKNIQMIFQDPMAALNGQNNIFSILKEPLVVNKIIKNRINDIKVDWKNVTDNFHYTFLEQALKLKLENLQIALKLYGPFIKKWQAVKLEEFTAEQSLDDQFNSYFAFLEEKSKINSIIINNLYKNSEKLISLFEAKQSDYRNQKIDFDEVELANAQKEYKFQKLLRFHTKEYLDAKQLLKETYKNHKNNCAELAELSSVGKNALKNFKYEFKNEAGIHKNEAFSSSDLDYFFHQYKLYKINNQIKKEFHKRYQTLNFLSLSDLKTLMQEIQDYGKNFYENKLKVDQRQKASIKEIKKIVKEEFKFDFSKYETSSLKTKKELSNKNMHSRKQLISTLKKAIKEFAKLPKSNKENLEAAKKNLEKTKEVFDQELDKFIVEYQKRISGYREEIAKLEAERTEILNIEKEETKKFFEIHRKFNDFFKRDVIKVAQNKYEEAKRNFKLSDSKAQDDKTQKSIKRAKNKLENLKTQYKQKQIDLKIYNTNIIDKVNSNKSFDIELKIVEKDINNIYLLLGISDFDQKVFGSKIKGIFQSLTSVYRNKRLNHLFTQTTIYKALEDVGLLKQFAYRYPHEFSGGQRQRIVIARALITQPSVIVADEPIASLDISIQAQVVNLLKDLCKEKNIGMVFIAHDLSMIEYIADRVQIMHLGKIVESGVTEKIYQNPVHPYTKNLFKAIPKISNANEKFKDVSFETSYLLEQQYPNIPSVHEIEPQHCVYGTDEQIAKWTNKNN